MSIFDNEAVSCLHDPNERGLNPHVQNVIFDIWIDMKYVYVVGWLTIHEISVVVDIQWSTNQAHYEIEVDIVSKQLFNLLLCREPIGKKIYICMNKCKTWFKERISWTNVLAFLIEDNGHCPVSLQHNELWIKTSIMREVMIMQPL